MNEIVKKYVQFYDTGVDFAPLIEKYRNHPGWKPFSEYGQASREIFLDSGSEEDLMVHGVISKAMHKYFHEAHPFAARKDEGYRIIHYREGNDLGPHVDACHGPQASRQLSFVLYLNDGFEGGETRFTSQDFSVKPKAGHILVFPSNFLFPHGSTPVTKGEKWVIVTWVHV